MKLKHILSMISNLERTEKNIDEKLDYLKKDSSKNSNTELPLHHTILSIKEQYKDTNNMADILASLLYFDIKLVQFLTVMEEYSRIFQSIIVQVKSLIRSQKWKKALYISKEYNAKYTIRMSDKIESWKLLNEVSQKHILNDKLNFIVKQLKASTTENLMAYKVLKRLKVLFTCLRRSLWKLYRIYSLQ